MFEDVAVFDVIHPPLMVFGHRHTAEAMPTLSRSGGHLLCVTVLLGADKPLKGAGEVDRTPPPGLLFHLSQCPDLDSVI